MATAAAARRYAQAVFELAVQRSELDKWREELSCITAVLGDPGVRAIMESPRVPFSGKQDLLRKVLPGISPLALNLSFLVVKTGKVSIIGRMVELYGDMVDAHRGIVHARVVTAVPMSDEEQRHVCAWLSQIDGKKVVMEAKTDPQILGGLVARIGDQVIDASVRMRLERLKRNLTKAGG